MKTPIKLSLLTLLFIALSISAKAQKKPFYTTQEEVVEAAYKALDEMMESGEIEEWIEKKLEKRTGEKELSGKFVYDLTIRGKGEVATVFKVECDAPIKVQNNVRDHLKELKFPFKMPKNKSFKFRYEFNF
jgi:hypothetical protein